MTETELLIVMRTLLLTIVLLIIPVARGYNDYHGLKGWEANHHWRLRQQEDPHQTRKGMDQC